MGDHYSLENIQARINLLTKQLIGLCYLIGMPRKIAKIHKKERIRVLFVLSEVSLWKTENLYAAMLSHPRFEPLLGVTTSMENASFRKPMEDYLSKKGYEWQSIDGRTVSNDIKPDIIFFQKPYYSSYFEDMRHDRHWNALFCYVGYAFNTMDADFAVNTGLYNFAWQIYFENELAAETRRPLMQNKGKNLLVTGMPIQDILLTPKNKFEDPWKQLGPLKRIIYAPHHTIEDNHFDGIEFSTFLSNADFMLQMAEKYKDKVQWAFKPHPFLYHNLLKVWGKEKTDNYYNCWAKLSNGQIVEGRYESLFKHSDAMIHDCGSFTIEYHYTLNPVLYLVKDHHHADNLNRFATKAYDLHYKASTTDEIETFIQNVICGKDEKKEDREQFYRDYLEIPNGKSACQNIMNAILGVEDYSQQ